MEILWNVGYALVFVAFGLSLIVALVIWIQDWPKVNSLLDFLVEYILNPILAVIGYLFQIVLVGIAACIAFYVLYWIVKPIANAFGFY